MAEVATRAEQPFFHAIYDLGSPRLVFGRVAHLGDAAFVARPHVGAGVTKAALDAVCLATAIAGHGGDLDAALARAGAGARLGREELDRRAAAVVSAYAANADELSRLAVDGSIPASA
jgi:2-polyprenyl-6-methoxyphenol hydroxylase-like FAD-dependent oxidoreductase